MDTKPTKPETTETTETQPDLDLDALVRMTVAVASNCCDDDRAQDDRAHGRIWWW